MVSHLDLTCRVMDNVVFNSKKGLKLIVKKPGYKSVQDSVDVIPNGWTVLIMRKLGKQC